MDNEEDEAIIEFIDKYSNDAPPTFFEREPSLETTVVRTMYFAMKSIVGQLNCPINTEAEAVTKWLIYKQAGPQRHQSFFGYLCQMNRILKNYNDMSLIKKLNVVLKKTENCGDNMYKLEPSALRYTGCAYIKRVYLLNRLRETCVKCANGAIGLLELEHWTNLSLVVVALCSQVHEECIKQLTDMEKVYNPVAGVFKVVDSRFPDSLSELEVVQKIKNKSRAFDDIQTDSSNLSAISRLLKLSAERIEEAQAENKMRMKACEILTESLTVDLTPVSTPKSSTSKQLSVQLDMSDIGISISRETILLNSAEQPCSSSVFDSEDEDDSLLLSTDLFSSNGIKKKKKKTAKQDSNSNTSTPKIFPKKRFLSSTMDLFSKKARKKP